jgi:hypothetical protein
VIEHLDLFKLLHFFMGMQRSSIINSVLNRPHSSPRSWVYWVVICALLLSQSLGLKHRIEHFEQGLNSPTAQARVQQSPDAKIIKDHQCSLLDALTLSTCLSVEKFSLELPQFDFVPRTNFYLSFVLIYTASFFQPRAPPAKD